MVVWREIFGRVLIKKGINLSISIALEAPQMNFYLPYYQNRKLIIILKFEIKLVDYVDCIVYNFSI